MYQFIHELLKDRNDGVVFKCFGIYHFIYIVIGIILTCYLIYIIKKNERISGKTINIVLNIAFSLYILDFFFMPLAYGEIDIEKLPFHACTAMCVMSFLSRRIKWLSKYKNAFAMLGLISNMVYFFYPAGVMWHQVHPLCYRVIQTLIYHMVMMIYGILVLVFERKQIIFKEIKNDCLVIILMTLWALIGNLTYNNILGSGRIYNWFFVVEDPFGIIEKSIAKYIMPFITPCAFMVVTIIIYFVKILFSKNIKDTNKS